uniref:Uncharacterized protein n=1 Tax=Anopheles merus TaxID=30066 RepID=A0A182VFX8_ANOME
MWDLANARTTANVGAKPRQRQDGRNPPSSQMAGPADQEDSVKQRQEQQQHQQILHDINKVKCPPSPLQPTLQGKNLPRHPAPTPPGIPALIFFELTEIYGPPGHGLTTLAFGAITR